MKKINIYSNKSINIISFFLTIFIILAINIPQNKQDEEYKNIIHKEDEKITEEVKQEKLEWYIEIPEINLKAPIQETTSIEVLNEAVGHFEETPLKEGNIGLAAHNRGYKNNYFENVKKLKKGQEIKYKYLEFEKKYTIDTIEIIKETNWSFLENTQENKITLITCVENKPEYRICVQATEKQNIN